MKTLRTTALLLLAALALTGCKPDAALKKGESLDKNAEAVPKSGPTVRVDSTTAGTIKGIVRFNGKPPARVPIDMSMDPACSMTAEQNLSEQFIVTHGGLGNVFVYIKAGTPDSYATPGTPPAVLDQKGCRYVPHVIAVQQGGTVEFRNSDPTMHNIHATPATAGNQGIDVSQGPMGAPQSRQFNATELMLPIRCNNHPWMNAFLNVAPNQWFTVTQEDGSFTIPDLPPGTYTLAAIHEKLGEQDIQIAVAPKSISKAEFTFSMKQ